MYLIGQIVLSQNLFAPKEPVHLFALGVEFLIPKWTLVVLSRFLGAIEMELWASLTGSPAVCVYHTPAHFYKKEQVTGHKPYQKIILSVCHVKMKTNIPFGLCVFMKIIFTLPRSCFSSILMPISTLHQMRCKIKWNISAAQVKIIMNMSTVWLLLFLCRMTRHFLLICI